MRVPEDSKWEDVQEPSQWEGKKYQALSPGEDVHLQISQWENRREPELSQVRDSSNKERSQEPDYRVQEGAAEAGHALPRASSVPRSPMDTETADAAPAGIAEEEEPENVSLLRKKMQQVLLSSVRR